MAELQQIVDIKEHIKEKAMWAGSISRTLIKGLLGFDGEKIVAITAPHTPALLKIFDEVLVNAIDQAKANSDVHTIIVTYKDGRFSVYNDGNGIPTDLHKQASDIAGKPIYNPEVAFSSCLTGTNNKKNKDNVKGGINGLGAKIANIRSTVFEIETVYNKIYYSQKWRNEMSMCEPPIMRAKSKTDRPHTLVSFIPVYDIFGYPEPIDFTDLDHWIHLRCLQASAYLERINVNFNDIECRIDAIKLAELIASDAQITYAVAKSDSAIYVPHPMRIAIAVQSKGSSNNMSIVNGIVCNKGTHIDYVKKTLLDLIEAKLKKMTSSDKVNTTPAKLMLGVTFVIIAAFPFADWDAQTKDKLQLKKGVIESYKIPNTFLKESVKNILDRIITNRSTKKTDTVMPDKYWPAIGRNSDDKTLLIVEGDSAFTFVGTGLSQNTGPTKKNYGVISIQGVITNAIKETSIHETSEGDTMLIKSAKLDNSKRLNALATVLNLQSACKYETDQEMRTLSYNRIILCVDQDLDGTGKIAPLILTFIYRCWPNLVKNGFISRFITPLVRAYPKKRTSEPKEFYNDEDFQEWATKEDISSYAITYYKGLATHDNSEVKRMFTTTNFNSCVYTYSFDDIADKMFDIYFGASAALRKIALSNPVQQFDAPTRSELQRLQLIPIGAQQMAIEAHLYKLDAIARQIICVVDGLTNSRRKIVFGLFLTFAEAPNKKLKVFQVGGNIANKAFYHHGDMSLNSTIIHMAQSFPGARLYPLITGVGQFGSRHGFKAGSARYINIKMSQLLLALFPPADKYLLKYNYEDGERAEPVNYIPTVPIAVLESNHTVSEGWNHKCYGRELDHVLYIVKAYISGDTELLQAAEDIHSSKPISRKLVQTWHLPVETRGFIGSIRYYKDRLYSFGKYHWDEDKRIITVLELPMGVLTLKFIEKINKAIQSKKHDLIENIIDMSNSTSVNVRIKLRAGAIDYIRANYGAANIDPIEDFLLLRSSLRAHLNYYKPEGGVIEFAECYLSAILYWAPLRRKLYEDRLQREKILLELKIIEEENILRYIEMAAEINISDIDDEALAEKRLFECTFVKINSALLHKPEYTPISELHELITTYNTSYDYIFNLKARDLVKSRANLRRKRIISLSKELKQIKLYLAERPIIGASLWRKEIDGFRAIVAEGIRSEWAFDA